MADEAVEDFKSSLADLTFNSKPLINMLTMLAEEDVQYSEQIVKVIEDHVKQAVPSQKLPALYLIDSIIKNIATSNYLQLFTKNIVNSFVVVFEKVDEKTRQSMFKLRQTWNDLFPNTKLYTLDVRVNHIDPAWPITAQPPQTGTTNIHVNPKFLMKQHSQELAQTSVSAPVVPVKEKDSLVHRIEDVHKEEANRVNEELAARSPQHLLAKDELEVLRLEQQKLELALAEARSKLEQQALKLREGQQTVGETTPQSMSTSVCTSSHVFLSKTVATVAPCTRDPRTKQDSVVTTVDQRLISTSLGQQTAVVLPTQSKPVNMEFSSSSLMSFLQPDRSHLHYSTAATAGSSGSAGNIFDRLQNLVAVKSGAGGLASVATAPEVDAGHADRKDAKQEILVPELKPERFSLLDPRMDVSDSQTCDSGVHSETGDVTAEKPKPSSQQTTVRDPSFAESERHRSRSPKPPHGSGEVQNSGEHEAVHQPARASPGTRTSGSAKAKFPKREAGLNRRSSPVQDSPEAVGRLREDLIQEDGSGQEKCGGGSRRGNRRTLAGRRRTSSHDWNKGGTEKTWSTTQKGSYKNEHDGAPAAKKMKHTKSEGRIKPQDLESAAALPSDLAELFGKEDKDYRNLPTIPKRQPLSPRRQPLLGVAPSSSQPLLGDAPSGSSSPQSLGWANFKANHPSQFLPKKKKVPTATLR